MPSEKFGLSESGLFREVFQLWKGKPKRGQLLHGLRNQPGSTSRTDEAVFAGIPLIRVCSLVVKANWMN